MRIRYNLALHEDGHTFSSFVIDEREYFGAAHVLAEGRGFSFFDTALWVRPPLYVLFLSTFIVFFGSNTVPVVVAQAVLSALSLLPLAWLAERIAGRGAARWAVAIGAAYLPFTLFAGLLLSETLFVLLFGVALVALVKTQGALAGSEFASGLRWAGASGVLLGLCALTRATALGFVPLALGWLFFTTVKVDARKRLAVVGVAFGLCALVILPWTVRNYRAYGRFVLVDTTSGYNLWLGSVGVRDEERLQADLRAIPNPADRESYAYARAWENISADPAAFVRKGLKESLDLWLPSFSAEERQVKGYTLGRVDARHLYGLLVLDDLLYVLILVLSVVGLGFAARSPIKSLTALWVLLWVAMSFVFFAVTRFRLPVVAVLIPWAGAGVSMLFSLRGFAARIRQSSPVGSVAAAVLLLGIVVIVVPAISFSDTALGAEQWVQQEPYRSAEIRLAEGNPNREIKWAIENYNSANLTLPDTRYGLAAALLQTGDTQAALAQLTTNEPPDRFEPFIIRGEVARRSNNLTAAKAFFNERVVKLAGNAALQWAWDHLDPLSVSTIEVGSGLDVGYVRGFYGPETDNLGVTFRWAGEDAEIRTLRPYEQKELKVVWSGWRPDGLRPATVDVYSPSAYHRSSGGQYFQGSLIMLSNKPTWETVSVLASAQHWDDFSAPLGEMEFRVQGFVPGGSDPRLLGIRISQISIKK